MSDKNNGGAAFPEPINSQCGGMSLRDYFAAKAMQGIASAAPHNCVDPRDVAEDAYQFADAMLAERAK